MFVESSRSVLTLYFHFVSTITASTTAAAMTFTRHFNTVLVKPYIFGTEKHGSGEMYWMTFKWRLWHWLRKNLFVCTIKWEPLIQSLQNLVVISPLVMLITWSDYGGILLKNIFLANFFLQFWSNTRPYHRNGWSNFMKWKESALVWILGEICDLDLWPHPWPWPWIFSRSNFKIAVSQEVLFWLMWSKKEVNQILDWLHDLAVWPHPWPWPWSLKVKVWNRPISGRGGLIDMVWKGCEWSIHDCDIDLYVTMVGWVNIPDSDRGGFRHRCAIDISSWVYSVENVSKI